ncbi:MAG: hypothetical protein WCY92_04270 [Novosphingobium sp.]|uniref:hypothetical protein n=1 Tax=Tsuneonella sp. CC-YZS046 TaxID=3042152 RepID=UPI002D776740|nr:hypothetical protein [Tsuneonella sp. CC-YZS046]WRO66736.1 hypothetical protein U8326_00790 [Tsuneonella sp. CC-YZS046]
MDESTKRAIERGVAWTGPIFVVGYFLCWGVLGRNIPPPNMMAMTGEQLVAEYYSQPTVAIGMIGAATFGIFYTIWSCLLAATMRDESGSMGVLSLLELSGGILTGWLLAFCSAIWASCAVLAQQVDADVIKMTHTFTWIIFDCTYMITTMQMFGVGLWTVLNKRQAIVPAWAGWTAIAIGAAFIALVFMPFVTEGPFTVDGLWNYWIIFGTWLFAYFAVYNFYLLKHVYRSPDQQRIAAGFAMA